MTVTFHLRPDLEALIMPEPLSMTTGWLAMTLAHRLVRTGRACDRLRLRLMIFQNQASSYSRSMGQNSVAIFTLHLLFSKQSYGCTWTGMLQPRGQLLRSAYHIMSEVFRAITKHVNSDGNRCKIEKSTSFNIFQPLNLCSSSCADHSCVRALTSKGMLGMC